MNSRQKKIVDGVLIGVGTALLVTFLSAVLGLLHVPGFNDTKSSSGTTSSPSNNAGPSGRGYLLTQVDPDNGQTNSHLGYGAEKVVDIAGKAMPHSIVYDCQQACGTTPDVAEYRIGGEFKWLTVTIAPTKTGVRPSGQGTTTIEGDGAVLETVPINESSSPRKFNLDVSGVETLTIASSAGVSKGGPTDMTGPIIAFGEPTLYK